MFPPADCLRFAQQYHIQGLVKRAFERLLKKTINSIQDEDCEKMGFRVYRELTKIKEAIDVHRRILTTEPPRIHCHDRSCFRPELCEAHWEDAWWNGMGRFLMDPYQTMTFECALEHFERLQFGEMGEKCKEALFKRIRDRRLRVFAEVEKLTDKAVDRLERYISDLS